MALYETEVQGKTESGKTPESKKAAAKRYSEKKKQRAEKRKADGLRLIETLKKNGTYDRLNAEEKAYLVSLTQDSASGTSTGGGALEKVFGVNPAVGKSVTLMECATQHGFGLQNMATYVKRWLDKGIEVEIVPAAKPLDTKYVYKGAVK